eukprot:jgi/Mesen1/4156/ME000219S03285
MSADVNMMGYANPSQNAAGIHFRLRSRAFIIGELQPQQQGSATPGNRLAFVSIDACMGSQGVTLEVFKRLKARYGELYNEKNVVISGIHTHSGPGGYLQYVLYLITSLGFVRQSFDAMVDGIVRSVVLAHENLREGRLVDANANRSPSAYLNNPAEERARYPYDTDKHMTLIKLLDDGGGSAGGGAGGSARPLGAVNWYPVHCVSMNRTNPLLLLLFLLTRGRVRVHVRMHAGPGTREALAAMAAQHPATGGRRAFPLASKLQRRRSFAGGEDGRPPFVAAFAQSNEGDVTPNTGGAFCLDTGLPCDFNTSTCNGRSTLCYGRGPAYPWGDHFDSTRIIAELQFHKARELFEGASEALRGPVDSRMMYLHMADLRVELPPDTPGGKPRVGNLFWRFVRSFIKIPSRKQVLCQHPKPVLLDTGELNTPYAWAPSILPISIHRVGQLILLAVPAEAGLRRGFLRGVASGASTLYGPHTLSAYIQEFRKLARALASGTAVPEGPAPAALTDRQLSFLPPVVADSTPAGASFGGMKRDVPANATFAPGAVVEASFFTGCLRNDLHTEGTFVSVERLSPDGASWASVHDDDDWCLRFSWTRPFPLSTESHANVRWEVPGRCPPGVYRLRHNGAYKHLLGSIHHFTGASRAFVVTSDKA